MTNEEWLKLGEVNIYSPRERARTELFTRLTNAGWPGWAAAMRLNWRFLTGAVLVMILQTILVECLANHVRGLKDQAAQYKQERDACLAGHP